MKRNSLTILFACCALMLVAQDSFKVKCKGAQPTINDFVSAFVHSRDNVEVDEEECVDEAFNAIRYVWDKHLKGIPLEEGQTLTIDTKNGYVLYENRWEYESVEDVVKMEMCYWNEADRKHKLFAFNVVHFRNGVYDPGQFDGIVFYRYDNATKTMTYCNDIDTDFEAVREEGWYHCFALPRKGKDIIVTSWTENGSKQRTLKWDGHRFKL